MMEVWLRAMRSGSARKGLSSVVGAVIIVLIMLSAVSFLYFYLNKVREETIFQKDILSSRSESVVIAKSVSSWWLLKGTDLVINITSRYRMGLAVTSITIVLSTGRIIVISKANGTVSSGTVVLVKPSGSTSTFALKLPLGIGSGDTVNITLAGVVSGGEKPVAVSLTLSTMSSISASVSISVKNYYEVYPPSGGPPSGGVVGVNYSVHYLDTVFTGETVAVKGYNYSLSSFTANPESYDVLLGSYSSGTLDDVYARDGNYLVIDPISSVIFSGFADWQYYREIIITNPNPYNYSNIQVKIVLDSSNFDFTKVNSDGSDLRFIDENLNQLYYWIQEWDPVSEYGVVWVKIPYIQANSSVKIYMLYGNPSATFDPEYYGLTKIMEPLPASDGPGYRIQYENWTAPDNLFDPNNGVPQGWHGDDGAWSLSLPFSFPYYNETFNSFYVCSNGFLSSTYITDYTSTIAEFRSRLMISPFWADLRTDRGGDIYVNASYSDDYLGTTLNGVYIRWNTRFYPNSGNQNFAVVLYDNGLIRFDYGSISGTSTTDNTPVIGISLGDNIHYTLLVSSDSASPSAWSNHNSVYFWPRKKPDTEFSVTIGDEKLNRGYGVSVGFDFSADIVKGVNVVVDFGTTIDYLYRVELIYDSESIVVDEGSGSSDLLDLSITGLSLYVSGAFRVVVSINSSNSFSAGFDYMVVDAGNFTGGNWLLFIAEENATSILMCGLPYLNCTSLALPVSDVPQLSGPGNVTLAYDGLSPYGPVLWLGKNNVIVPYNIFNRTWLVNKAIYPGYSFRHGGFIASNGSHLFVCEGEGSDQVYIISITTGARTGLILLTTSIGEYSSTAITPDQQKLYIHTGTTGQFLEIDLATETVNLLAAPPSIYSVGLDYDQDRNLVWLIERNGGIHSYNPTTNSWNPLQNQPPYYPQNQGDRLVYCNNKLYHIREDGTREIWTINLP